MISNPIRTKAESRIPDLIWATGIFIATSIAYGPALGGGLLWNDADYVTSAALRSWRGLWRIWFELGATEQYYPLLHSAFWLEHRLWGDATIGYHLTNVVLHATAACLFALVLGRLGGIGQTGGLETDRRRGWPPGAEWLAALIFALHPVCVESVAWISEQKNTLSTVFYLSAALAYLRFRHRGHDSKTDCGGRFYLLATLLFVLALLTKTVTATLPAALLVALWWRRGRLAWKEDFLPLLPWFALGAAAGLFTGWVERRFIGAQGPDFALTFAQRCAVAGREFWFYLGKLLWPGNLIFIYPRWSFGPGEWWPWLCPLGVVALTAFCWLLRRRIRAPLAALLFFIGSLFPTLGFFNVYAFLFSFVADHWQYLASLGVIALAVGVWARWRQISAGRAANAAAFAVVAALGILTWRQCRMYRGAEIFYRTILERNPTAWMAQNNLGILLAKSERIPEAISHYDAALRIRPNYAEARNNLGNALARSGRLYEAIDQYRGALLLDPAYRDAHNNLGNALLRTGRQEAAIAEYEKALQIDPDYPQGRNNLGSALREIGRLREAVEQFRRAVRLEPENPEVHNDLGVALAETGRLQEGIAEVEKAVRLSPDYADAKRNLSVLLGAAAAPEPKAEAGAPSP